ncbi:MAG: cupin domain-containing protein, partial [Burkholderiales bacterium]
EGQRLAFGLFEVPAGYDEPESVSAREMFVYVLSGSIDAQSGSERKTVSTGDIVCVPKGERYRMQVRKHARYAVVCSTPWLEDKIDNLSPEEAEQARVNMKPN